VGEMSKLEDLVPPIELCKLIPKGEFEDSAFIWDKTTSVGFWDGEDKDGNHIGGFGKIPHNKYRLRQNYSDRCRKHLKDQDIELDIFPAPTLQEILEELHKLQEDVFLKWSPKAYHSWLINAYTHDKEDYQDHDSSAVTAALTVWLKMKWIDYEK
jgi:hypothetical protein